MAADDDAFWNELGVSWRASIPDAGLMAFGLELRLKRQSTRLIAGSMLAGAVGLAGLLLAAWALWMGWSSHAWNFLTRGATLAVVSLLAVMAGQSLRARSAADARSLREKLQLCIAWTQGLVRAADLGCCALMVLALGGTIGYALRIRLDRPPAVPLIEDLLALGIVGLALLWYRHSQAHELRRYRHLRQVFDSADESR